MKTEDSVSLSLFISIYLRRSFHYAVTHVRNENSNIQGMTPYAVKVSFHTIRNSSKRREFAPEFSGSEIFPLREVPILKRDAIEENRCLI